MGRIRAIKPEFPQSESIGRLSRDARLCFVQLWTIADDAGRARASSRMLASLLYPYDDDARDLIDGWLDELEANGLIRRYEVDGAHYLDIPKWLEHQRIDRPSKSKMPALDERSTNPREPSTKARTRGPGPNKRAINTPTVANYETAPQPVENAQFDESSRALDDPSTTEGSGREGRESESRTDSESPGENQNLTPTMSGSQPDGRESGFEFSPPPAHPPPAHPPPEPELDLWDAFSLTARGRSSKAKLRRAVKNALNGKATLEQIREGLRRYQAHKPDEQYHAGADRFVRDGIWKTYLEEEAKVNGTGRKLTQEELNNVATNLGLPGQYTDAQKKFLKARGLWDARQGGPPGWAKAQLR